MGNLISLEHEDVIQEIKMATGYDNVYFVKNSYVIDFDITKSHCIKGLRTCKNSFVLDFEFLNGMPISFLVRTKLGNILSQYWTLNGQLHRGHDLPATVFIDEEKQTIIRKWYWNGVLHRTNGPAKQRIVNYQVDYDLKEFPYHFKESWDELNQEWWSEGYSCLYPTPKICSIDTGYHLKRKLDKVLDSPAEDFPAVVYDRGIIEWDNNEEDALLPKEIEFVSLQEWYENAKFLDRNALKLMTAWVQGNKEIAYFYEIDNFVLKHFLNDLGLWSAPFYRKDDIEFLLLSEYDKLKDSHD